MKMRISKVFLSWESLYFLMGDVLHNCVVLCFVNVSDVVDVV